MEAKDIKINHIAQIENSKLKRLCYQLTCEISAANNWNLIPQLIDELLEQTWPHIKVSISDSSVYIHKNIEEDIVNPNETKIRNIIINYYHDGPDVNALNSDFSIQQKFQKYFENVVRRKPWSLPEGIDVEDLVQEVWINIFLHLDSFHFRSRFTTWAYMIIINTWRGLVRGKIKEKKYKHISIDGPISDNKETLKDIIIVDPNSNPEEKLSMKELVEKAIDEGVISTKKAIRNKEIISMWLIGEKQREIADKLNLPLNTVTTIINRIKKKSIKFLSEDIEEA